MNKRVVRMVLVLAGLVLLIILGQLSGNEPRLDAVTSAQQQTGLKLESSLVNVGTLRLHVVQAGPADGVPVVLLHGFPEFWYAWRDVIPPLVAAGLRVIVPDQRGYADSDKPKGIASYRIDLLGDDIAGLIRVLGHKSACVVAHDWGAGTAWNLALRYPARVNHLVVIDNIHPDAEKSVASSERKISWYRSAFQLPLLPEWISRLFHWAVVSKMLRDTAEPGAFPDDKLAQYRSAWDRDGAYSAMVNWYRADHLPSSATGRTTMPTLLLLAPHDSFIPADLVRASLAFLEQGRLVELKAGTHWVIQEHPEVIAREVAGFCTRSR